MNMNQPRARGPTKAPMRGTGRPSRPPIGARGGGQRNAPMQHQQQAYQQQPVYNQRGRGSSRGRGGVSRGGYPPQQRSYNQRGAYDGGQPQARHQPIQQQTMQQPMQPTMQTMQPMHNVQHVQQQQVNTQPMPRQPQPTTQRIQPMTNQAPAIPPMQQHQRQQVHSSMPHQRAPQQQQQQPVHHQPTQPPPQHQQQQQAQVQVQQQQVVQPMQRQQQPVHSTMQQQREPLQQPTPQQQQPPQQQQAARRPPMTTNNVTSFEHYSGAQAEVQSQQQQQEPPAQQPMMTQQHQQPMVQTTEAVQQQVVQQEKASTEVTTGVPSGGPSPTQVKKPPSPARRIPPWEAFTGRDKPHPTKYGWAQRVRQVMSADTVKLALFRDPNSKVDPLKPPDFIQVTLDGIDTPRCERYMPPARMGQRSSDDDGKSPSSPSKSLRKEDDPFAYEAREFVRKKLMNKMVFYAIWRSDENSSRGPNQVPRKWGDVYYKEGQGGGEMKSLTQELIIAGLAERAQRKTDLSQLEKDTLDAKQAEAQAALRGKWNEKKADQSIRKMTWVPRDEQAQFGEKFLNKTLSGVVDGVISGSSLRVELCVDKDTMDFRNVVVSLAGVNAPRVPMNDSQMDNRRQRNKSPVEEKLETFFGEPAKEWTEMRLLSQEVKVRVLFTTNQQIVTQVMCAQGRIGPSLVKKGLARYEKWSATAVDAQERKMLEEAHKFAVSHKLNVWQYARESSRKDARTVTVTQVISGDTLEVLDPTERGKNGEKKKVRYTLSSIRAPRIGTRGGYRPREESKEDRGQNGARRGGRGGRGRGGGQNGRDEWSTKYGQPDQYLSREAKEFVRKMCIGKEVKLHYEYDRKMGPPRGGGGGRQPQQKKKFATILVQDGKGNEVNLALELMKRGLCELVLHGKNDEDRSMAYVELEKASKKAIADKTGVHKYTRWNADKKLFEPDERARANAAKQNKIKDYSGNDESNVALHELTSLNQSLLNRRVAGIVEFVFGANRVKIYMPKKNACIAVRLAGIRVGNYTSNRSEDPVSKRAKEYLNDTIVQREVEVFVTSASTGGPSGGRGRRGRGRGRGAARGANTGSRNPNLDGHILLNGVNIADYLLRHGLASLIVYRSGNQRMATEETANFKHNQDQAIAEKLGVWESMDDEGGDDSKLEANYAARSKTGATVEVVVSYSSSATEFYVNDANSKQMGIVCQKLKELSQNPKIPQAKEIKKGKKVKFAAKYDGYYARCRVSNPDNRARTNDQGGGGGKKGGGKMGNWFVDFIDFGNRASVARDQLAELPPELRVDRIPPLAMKCVLAGLRVDPDGHAFRQAGLYFASYVFSETEEVKMKMKILHDDLYNKTWYVDLMVGDQSINQMLAFEGFVTQYGEYDLPLAFKSKTEYEKPWSKEHIEYVNQYFKDIRANISAAKADHRNIFKYGDVEDDPDDNLGDR